MVDSEKTSGQTQPLSERCVKSQEITNKFKIMISKARKAQKIVLLRKANDIILWSSSEQSNFLKTFNFIGDETITIRKQGINTGKQIKARFLMMDGIRRIMKISNSLTTENFKDYTKCNKFAAFVEPHLDPPYIVNIGKNFESRDGKKNPITGEDSHVSTLCHEMSHIYWYWKNKDEGGMWTQDYTDINKFATSDNDEISYKEHVAVANKLIKLKKEQLFENAYNIERYFHEKVSDADIDSADEIELSKEVNDKILELQKELEKMQKTDTQ